MSTKKSKKAKTAKSASRAKPAAAPATAATPAAPKGPHQVVVMVNGQVTGSVPSTSNMLQAARDAASRASIRSFSLKVDGKKVENLDGEANLENVRQIELVTKDSRG